jgi:hypothetical protein
MLNNTQMAGLAARLQVPLIVGDILAGEGALTDEVHYALHEVISDLQPDSALLAIAISTRKITRVYEKASPGIKLLGSECNRIIDEYGEMWLQNAQNKNIDQDDIYDVLVHTAEDLEMLSELIELNTSFLRAKDSDAYNLCEILSIQAGAHAVIAEEFLSVAQDSYKPPASVMRDNVIPFPGQTIRA